MKTAALFLCLSLVVSGFALAQTWDLQSPLPTDVALTAVHFQDSLTGWIGGASALILKTADGGQTWTEQHLSASPQNEISGISFTNALNGWAVSRWDSLIHTTNGGATWTSQPTGFITEGGSVRFTSEQNGWIVGTTVLHTTNGGNSWEEVLIWSPNEFDGVCFLDDLHGWLGQSEDVFYTANGGATWTRYNTPAGVQVRSLAFEDASFGWMLGSSPDAAQNPDSFRVYRTANAGQTWNLCADSLTGMSGIVIGANNRVVVYGETQLLLSADFGSTWQTHPAPGHVYMEAMAATENRFCAISRNALIAFTADGWQWTYSGSGVSLPITNVRFADDEHGWAGGTLLQESAALLLRTTDGGTHWRPCDGVPKTGAVVDLACTDTNHVWAAVSNSTNGNILHSADGGLSWNLQMPDSTPSLSGVYFADAHTGWAAGSAGIYHTDNGGQDWMLQYPSEPLAIVTFIDTLRGWATTGANQNLFRTTDGGNSWQTFTTGIFDGIADMQFTDANHGIAATTGGVVKRSTNGGQNWTTVTGQDWGAVQRVDFADHLRGWLSGYTRITYVPAIWATYDGGATWMHLADLTEIEGMIDDVCLGDALDGWAAGARKIFRYRGVDAVHPETAAAPARFSISVFPNPFNARAMLNFDLPVGGRVSLTLFDVLGRTVETITDRVIESGRHSVPLDAAHLAGGVYFIRLKTPTASATQKIILMR